MLMFALALLAQDPPPIPIAPSPRETALVTLNCALQPTGSLADCRVVSETPADQGYGEVALENSRRARVALRDGMTEHPAGRVQFDTRIHIDPGPPDVVIALPNRR